MTAAADMGLDGLDGRLFALWMSGFARRWHMNPAMSHIEDFNCGHQGRCAMLVITLFPDHSVELLRAAVTHDAPEVRVGDLSKDMKKCGGEAVEAHAALERRVLTAMGFAEALSSFDRKRLKLVDRLDAFLFVQVRHPAEAGRNGWPEDRAWLVSQSVLLGCGAEVAGALDAALLGDFT
jgi:hypothetical protein|tara:strand:- start:1189 stop:1725 length:537 start_codon:yes stop_codon:yes gene_type:complete